PCDYLGRHRLRGRPAVVRHLCGAVDAGRCAVSDPGAWRRSSRDVDTVAGWTEPRVCRSKWRRKSDLDPVDERAGITAARTDSRRNVSVLVSGRRLSRIRCAGPTQEDRDRRRTPDDRLRCAELPRTDINPKRSPTTV